MIATELNSLIRQGEGTDLVFLERDSSSLPRSIAALANTNGGRILLDVSKGGEKIGYRELHHSQVLIQEIAATCDPRVNVRVDLVEGIHVVHVDQSELKPVRCSDGFFGRFGATTQKLKRSEIRDFFRNETPYRFDSAICSEFRYPEDFDKKKYDKWISLSRMWVKSSVEDTLVDINVAEPVDGKIMLRNAGVLFFAKDVRRFFPQAHVTCLLTKDSNKVDVVDRQEFSGGIVDDIESVMKFIERNTRKAYQMNGQTRKIIPEYPSGAVREAITNAVLHRDWFIEDANVVVEIYPDQIKVISPGGLMSRLKLNDFEGRSVRRNPLIADLLHRIDYIKKAGRGVQRMRTEVWENFCREPEFDSDESFVVTFWSNPQF